ncbi:hypothetical protein QNH23_03505 [Siminovitchia fortis]|uniref:Uncharacterized protein n=1 Tax=Siminovitchia fortis TaxID=254758 RepID=A0A443ITU2_9BACI|nr:hypothetical protein [Siminovitchia fortis]RWR11112.1 hypothetical protein D4N35_008955 [Siminovitchia fortis]WHY82469.1 hypothetical protein QNH23_03505 [Siminovitchia fortis]
MKPQDVALLVGQAPSAQGLSQRLRRQTTPPQALASLLPKAARLVLFLNENVFGLYISSF